MTGALVPYLIQLAPGRSEQLTVRRATDARLWQSMSTEQAQAAQEIRRAFEQAEGPQVRISNYGTRTGTRRPDSLEPNERAVQLHKTYTQWRTECTRLGIEAEATIDVMVLGMSCRSVDKTRRKGTGWTSRHLLAGLECYGQVRGWLERPN